MSDLRYLFLHGMPGDRRVFDLILELAPTGADLVADDLPGCGDEPKTPVLDLNGYEQELDRRIRRSPRPVVLVGYSFGAWLAARALARHREGVVRRVVVLGGFAVLPEEIARRNDGVADAMEQGGLGASECEELGRRIWFGDWSVAPEVAELAVRAIRVGYPERQAQQVKAASLPLIGQTVPPFTTEMLVLHGGGDVAVPVELGKQLSALGANATLRVIPGAPHAISLTHPEIVAEGIFRLGSRQQPSRGTGSELGPLAHPAFRWLEWIGPG